MQNESPRLPFTQKCNLIADLNKQSQEEQRSQGKSNRQKKYVFSSEFDFEDINSCISSSLSSCSIRDLSKPKKIIMKTHKKYLNIGINHSKT